MSPPNRQTEGHIRSASVKLLSYKALNTESTTAPASLSTVLDRKIKAL
jgi:hypothetical protein